MITGGQFWAIAEGELPPRLTPGCVHIWRAGTGTGEDLRECASVLSAEENVHAAKFYRERDRQSFVRCRAALRRLIGWYTGEDAAGVRIGVGLHGKPFLLSPEAPGLGFNVSHSGDIALLAFGLDCELGVDVELMREDVDFVGVADTVFSESEREALLACPVAGRARLFYEIWSCKEACIKADGRGLSLPLEHFSIGRLAQKTRWRDIVAHVPGGVMRDMHLRVLEVADGYEAAEKVAQGTSGAEAPEEKRQLTARLKPYPTKILPSFRSVYAAAVASSAPFSEIVQLDYPGLRDFPRAARETQNSTCDSFCEFVPFASPRTERNSQYGPGPDNRP